MGTEELKKITLTVLRIKQPEQPEYVSQIHFYRTHVHLEGETLQIYRRDVQLSDYVGQLENIIDRLSSIALADDVLQSDLDAILNACGRSPYHADIERLLEALESPTYNGKIDTYRQGCTEKRTGTHVQQVGLSTPLMFAVGRSSDSELVRHLVIEEKSDIHAINGDGHTAIYYAFLWDNIPFLRYLASLGGNIAEIVHGVLNNVNDSRSSRWLIRLNEFQEWLVELNTTRYLTLEALHATKLEAVSTILIRYVFRDEVPDKLLF